MTRPFAYISAPWGEDNLKNATAAANYCRQVYEAGYAPICPVLFLPAFLKGDAPAEVKDRKELSDELLKRCRILVVCGSEVNDEVRAKGVEPLPPVSVPFRRFLSRLTCWAPAQRRSLGAKIARKLPAHRCFAVLTERIFGETRKTPQGIRLYFQGV